MKKKVASIILSLCLFASMLPVTALAEAATTVTVDISQTGLSQIIVSSDGVQTQMENSEPSAPTPFKNLIITGQTVGDVHATIAGVPSGAAITLRDLDSFSLTANADATLNIEGNVILNSDSAQAILINNSTLTCTGTGYLAAFSRTSAAVSDAGNAGTFNCSNYSGKLSFASSSTSAFQLENINIKTAGDLTLGGGGTLPIINVANAAIECSTISFEYYNNQSTSTTACSLFSGDKLSLNVLNGGIYFGVEQPLNPIIAGNASLTAKGDIKIDCGTGAVLTQQNSTIDASTFTSREGSVTFKSLNSNMPLVMSNAVINAKENVSLTSNSPDAPTVNADLSVHAGGNILVTTTLNAPAITGTRDLVSTGGTVSVIENGGIDIGGVKYPYGGDIASTGVDLSNVSSPAYYAADSGYLLWLPDSKNAKLIMHDAGIVTADNDNCAITLPAQNVTIDLQGTNSIAGDRVNNIGILQGTPELSFPQSGSYQKQPYSLTLTGSGSLNVNYGFYGSDYCIQTDGTLKLENSGSIRLENYGIGAGDFIMSSGTLALNNCKIVSGNDVTVNGGTISSTAGDGAIKATGSANFNSGIVSLTNNSDDGVSATTVTVGKNAKLNALAYCYDESQTPAYQYTVYGDATVTQACAPGHEGNSIAFHMPAGTSVTIDCAAYMDLSALTPAQITPENFAGKIVNNGIIYLPDGTTLEQIKALGVTGIGLISVGKKDTLYTNSGETLKVVEAPEGSSQLDLGNTPVTAEQNLGYTWLPTKEGDDSAWTLTLSTAFFACSLQLPDKAVTVNTTGICTFSAYSSIIVGKEYPADVIFAGKGTLTATQISGGMGGKVTIDKDATVNVPREFSLGTSGGVDGQLFVNGNLTVGGRSSAINTGRMEIGSTGKVSVHCINGAKLNGMTTASGTVYENSFVMKEGASFTSGSEEAPVVVYTGMTPATEAQADKVIVIPNGYLPKGYAIRTVSNSNGEYAYAIAPTAAVLTLDAETVYGGGGSVTIAAPTTPGGNTPGGNNNSGSGSSSAVSGNTANVANPSTGDSSMIWLAVALLGISGGAGAWITLAKHGKRE